MLRSLARKVKVFLGREDGPTAVEYAVILALIVAVCVTAISKLGTNVNLPFEIVSDTIPFQSQ
jgi:pilus assembly protein Flp/PilA